jgi:ferredoxin
MTSNSCTCTVPATALICTNWARCRPVLAAATELGWPPGRLHLEHFGVGTLDPGVEFQVDVDGQLVTVPAGVSLLAALEQAGYQVPNLCRQGVCGECRITVLAGEVSHRDLFLDESEKSDGATMMCCVSRAAGSSLVVSL